jgi:hypothetical protein
MTTRRNSARRFALDALLELGEYLLLERQYPADTVWARGAGRTYGRARAWLERADELDTLDAKHDEERQHWATRCAS